MQWEMRSAWDFSASESMVGEGLCGCGFGVLCCLDESGRGVQGRLLRVVGYLRVVVTVISDGETAAINIVCSEHQRSSVCDVLQCCRAIRRKV
jgi:hypothetical protein